MKRAALLLLVAAILGILWIGIRIVRSPRSNAPGSVSRQESSEPVRVSLEARTQPSETAREVEKGAPPSEPHDAATSIRVRSSVGLPLAFAEVQTGEEPWQRRELNEANCELGEITRPCRLRAPGHSPATVDRLGVEIVLEPDALLVIEAPGLRGCVESIDAWHDFFRRRDPRDPEETELGARIARTETSGFLSEDRWAIAATSRMLPGISMTRQLEVTVEWPDRRRAEIGFHATPGTRAV